MRKQVTLLLIGVLVLFATFGQPNPNRLWARSESASAHNAIIDQIAPTQQADGRFLTGPNPGDPVEIAVTYLRQQAAHLGLTAGDLSDISVSDRYVTQYNGVTHLYLRQRYHGIEVFNGILNINISRNGAVINLGNRFVPNLAQALNTDTPSLAATAAVEYAAQHLNLPLTAPLTVIEDRNGPAHEQYLSPAGLSKAVIPAKLVYHRQDDGKVRLAWSLRIAPPAAPHNWLLRVDAVTGAILGQTDLILHDDWAAPWSVTLQQEQPSATDPTVAAAQPASPLTPPTYRVFPLPLEHPEDGAGLPNNQIIVKNSADTLASPYGWHDIDGLPGHEFTDTRGNNVAAQEDRNGDDSAGFRPTGKKPQKFNFDYRFDPTRNPPDGDNPAVAIVNIFYWNNILHDIAYRYGFDEVSGNMQENSYDRGGLGGDAVIVDVQDGYDWGARNNAFMSITPDGERPQMGMFVFDYTTPNRDSALDNGIVTHEYVHGISTRLVGGPSNVMCLMNGEQMGEGWSDWFTLALTAKAGDSGVKGRSLGTYVLGQPADGPGIRRYPYSTDLAIDPFTYADMRSTGGDIYLIGQIWGSMLWDLHWNLIEQGGFDPNLYTGAGGNNTALRLVMDGMKLAPCEPGFVDARNALLTADQINNGGANHCLIWQTFARRGLGFSAAQGSPYRSDDGHAAFDLPTSCLDELMLTKHATPVRAEAGKVLTYTLVVGNYLADSLNGVTLSDPIPAGATYVEGSASDGGTLVNGAATWPITTLEPDAVITRTFQVLVNRTLATGAVLSNTATVLATTGETDSATLVTAVISVPDLVLSSTSFEETLAGGATVTRDFTIHNAGPAPLTFSIIEQNLDRMSAAPAGQAVRSSPPATPATGPARQDQPRYTGNRELAPTAPLLPVPMNGLRSATAADVLLLAAADVSLIQETLRGFPDLGLLDSYDARLDTPTLEQLLPYDTVIVIANNAFADSQAIGDVLANYIDTGGTVIQTTPTFFDAEGNGWGLRGRFMDDGYSPFVGSGDWFTFAELGAFDATHPIMQGVATAGDSLRQMVDLTADAQLVASWTDDEFVATKGNVVALNTFLADGSSWVGDIPLIVHNSIIWLQSKGEIDAPWLTVTPITGTLAEGETQVVQVTFDARAAAVERAGDHGAWLRILSNDPHHFSFNMPITLHVRGPELSLINTTGYFGRKATVPVNFAGQGLHIAATAFAVNFDESCLRLDPTDADSNGIPDAVKLMTPPGFELIARANISDTNSELNLFIGDLTPPLTALPDGPLVTIDLKASCQPQETPLPVRVGFATAPSASFSDLQGVTMPGQLVEGAVAIQPGLSGDCNQDGLVNAADPISCLLEIFDDDGTFWLDAPGGAFPGSPQGCDSNQDAQIDAGDLLCTVLTIFQGPGACQQTGVVASSAAPATLALPTGLTAQPGGAVTVPVHLTGNGNPIAAVVFALTFDPARLSLDQTDSDGNGIPDAITFNLPDGVTASVQVIDNRRLQFAIADLSLPFVSLPDGPLANITFTTNVLPEAATATSVIAFADDLPASVGNHTGQSTAVTTADGAVLMRAVPPESSLPEKSYLPVVAK